MASTNTKSHSTLLDNALANIPAKFKKKLIEVYLEIKRNQSESRFDSTGLSAGKFCEVVIRLLQHEVFGNSTPFGIKIPNMADECRKIITSPITSSTESVRNIIPREIIFIYTLCNKRGIGHVGGDVDAKIKRAGVIYF